MWFEASIQWEKKKRLQTIVHLAGLPFEFRWPSVSHQLLYNTLLLVLLKFQQWHNRIFNSAAVAILRQVTEEYLLHSCFCRFCHSCLRKVLKQSININWVENKKKTTNYDPVKMECNFISRKKSLLLLSMNDTLFHWIDCD